MGFSECEKLSGVSVNKLLNISWSNSNCNVYVPLAWSKSEELCIAYILFTETIQLCLFL